jgi:hypothetical protein
VPGQLGQVVAVAAADVGNGLTVAQAGQADDAAGQVDAWSLMGVQSLAGRQVGVRPVLDTLE